MGRKAPGSLEIWCFCSEQVCKGSLCTLFSGPSLGDLSGFSPTREFSIFEPFVCHLLVFFFNDSLVYPQIHWLPHEWAVATLELPSFCLGDMSLRTTEEEALLVFAACGVCVLYLLPHQHGRFLASVILTESCFLFLERKEMHPFPVSTELGHEAEGAAGSFCAGSRGPFSCLAWSGPGSHRPMCGLPG